MGVVPGASSMLNSISQSGGRPGSSSGTHQGTRIPLELFSVLKCPLCSALVAVMVSENHGPIETVNESFVGGQPVHP